MANKIAVVYQHIKINNKWTFKKAPAMRRRFLSDGAYYISWYEGTRKRMERVGPDPTHAEKALLKKSAELSFFAVGGEIKAKWQKMNPLKLWNRMQTLSAKDASTARTV